MHAGTFASSNLITLFFRIHPVFIILVAAMMTEKTSPLEGNFDKPKPVEKSDQIQYTLQQLREGSACVRPAAISNRTQ
jgi:hypothetical protein